MDVTITLLGGFSVAVGDARRDQESWPRRQAASLVKILALAPGLRLHREQVLDLLWPELSIEDAAPRLHKAAHFARRVLGQPGALVLAGDSVALFPRHTVRVDAQVFEALAEAAVADRDPSAAAAAADAYGGELLPQDRYEEWADQPRDRLQLLYLQVLRLARRWETLATVDPTDEDAHLRVIAELESRGERRSALRQFERLERALREELGVAPSVAARDLRARLLSAPPDTASVGAPSGSDPGQPPRPPTTEPRPAPPPVLVGDVAGRERLIRLLDTVESGSGRTLFVSGPPGIGKTTQLAWLEQAAADRGWRVGSGLAAQVEGAWPYAPVLEAFADLCRRHPTLLDGLDDALKAEIESCLSGREVSWRAPSGHQRLFVAAAELLRLAAAGSGALLVVDDAHQADAASLRLMHYLARNMFRERVLLVLAHRPQGSTGLAEMHQSLDGRGTAVAHEVPPMTREEVSTLARQLSPGITDDHAEGVWAASNGLPFSVVELTRAGAAHRSLSAAIRPPTMSEQQLLACTAAAVLGQTFDTDEFLRIAGLPEDEAYAVLDAALEQRLIIRTDTGYAFRHSIIRETLLDDLRPSQGRALHRRAATALQALGRSPSRIGHHLVQAGDHRAAVAWVLRAAETSAAMGANSEALATLDSVRSQAEGADLERLLSLRADLLMAAADAGAVDAYREALAVVTEPADRSRLRARLARVATFAGDLDTAAIALDGLVTDGSIGDAELLIARGNLALFQGDLEAADAAASEARRRVTLARPDDWQAFELISLQGLVAHNRGEWFERLRMELRLGAGQPALAAKIFDSHLCVAEYLLYGPTPYPEVLELAAALRATAERSGALRAVAFATALRGETALLMGDLPLAETELEEAAALHRDIGSSGGEAHSLQRLAEVKLELGDRKEANRLLRRALPLARFTSIANHLLQRIYGTMIVAETDPAAARAIVDHSAAALGVADQCPFCAIMLALPAARACAAVGDLEDATRYLREAQASARMWEGTSWQASILETRGHLAAAEGDPTAARQLRQSAAELFEASGQPRYAERCRSAPASPPKPAGAAPSSLSR